MTKIKELIKKDRLFFIILTAESLILLYLIAKGIYGQATELGFSGNAFFDNVRTRGFDNIVEDGEDLVIESMPSEQQADLEHGVRIYSNEFALRSGAYIVTADYESLDGEVIEHVLDSNGYLGIRSNEKESTCRYDDIYLDDQHHQVSGRVYVPAFSSVNDLQLFIHYDGPGELRVKSVTIKEQKIYRFMQVLGYLFCFAIFDLVFFLIFSPLYKKTGIDFLAKGKPRVLLVSFAVLVFVSAPLLSGYLYRGHDILFHLNRIEALASGMRYHTLPLRIQTDLLEGYGYCVPLYYCDLFLYPSAFLYGYCMLPLRMCYQLYIFMINILTIYTSYRCFKVIFSDEETALMGMALYSLSAYRLTDIYLRSAVGEFTAFAFLPLVAEGIYRIYTAGRVKAKDWLPLAVGMGCLLQSHVISTVLVGAFILFFLAAGVRRLDFGKILALIKAGAVAMCMSVWFIVPMLESLSRMKPVVTGISTRIQWTGVYLTQLFEILPGGYGISREGTAGDMPLGLGGGLSAGFFLILIYMLTRNIDGERDSDSQNAKILNISFGLGTLALWMSTVYFPRDLIARLLIGRLDFVRSLWEVMEYVWRHLTIATLMLGIAFAALSIVIRKRFPRAYIPVLMLVLSLTILSDMSFYRDFTDKCPQYRFIEMSNDQMAYMDMSADFDLVWGMTRRISDGSVVTDGTDISVDSYEKDGADRILVCSNQGSSGEAVLPLFDFVHYHAFDMQDGSELQVSRSGLNARLAVTVPGGFNGSIRISYIPPVYWHICEAISLLAWVLLAIYGIMVFVKRGHEKA